MPPKRRSAARLKKKASNKSNKVNCVPLDCIDSTDCYISLSVPNLKSLNLPPPQRPNHLAGAPNDDAAAAVAAELPVEPIQKLITNGDGNVQDEKQDVSKPAVPTQGTLDVVVVGDEDGTTILGMQGLDMPMQPSLSPTSLPFAGHPPNQSEFQQSTQLKPPYTQQKSTNTISATVITACSVYQTLPPLSKAAGRRPGRPTKQSSDTRTPAQLDQTRSQSSLKDRLANCVQRVRPVTGSEDIRKGIASEEMAPVRDPNSVPASLKEVIQNLYELQSHVHGFVPETQPILIDKMAELAHSLAHLQKITSPTQSPNNPIHQTRIAPEIIDYVDDGRNPDIYTRDFVELVQRGNAVINGKQQAFRDFSVVFANALKVGVDGIGSEVDRVMKNAHLDDHSSVKGSNGQENGARPS